MRERPETQTQVSLAEVAATISRAADLATGQPLDHVVRACAIASLFADHLGLPPEERTATYWVSPLMISGCSAVSFELSRLFGDDIGVRGGGYGIGPSTLEQTRYVFGRAGGDRPLVTRTRVRVQPLGTRLRPFRRAMSGPAIRYHALGSPRTCTVARVPSSVSSNPYVTTIGNGLFTDRISSWRPGSRRVTSLTYSIRLPRNEATRRTPATRPRSAARRAALTH